MRTWLYIGYNLFDFTCIYLRYFTKLLTTISWPKRRSVLLCLYICITFHIPGESSLCAVRFSRYYIMCIVGQSTAIIVLSILNTKRKSSRYLSLRYYIIIHVQAMVKHQFDQTRTLWNINALSYIKYQLDLLLLDRDLIKGWCLLYMYGNRRMLYGRVEGFTLYIVLIIMHNWLGFEFRKKLILYKW